MDVIWVCDQILEVQLRRVEISFICNAPRYTNALVLQSRLFAGRDVVGDLVTKGYGRRVLVVVILASNGAEQMRGILDCSRHGTNGVLVLGNGYHEVSRSETDSGLDTNKVVVL
ncbi:hypothetical protein HC256_009142 [Beauveria bassiana]|nr:hypothetical protein HC256_009142 [Beauveria bassiana]